MAVLARAKSTVYGLVTDLATLQTNIDNEASTRETADTDLQTELDATQTGAGLAVDGSYVANGTTNYIGAATSLVSANELLDTAIKTADDRAKGVEGVLANLATSVKTDLVSSINSLNSRVTTEVSTLNSTITTKEDESIDRDDALDARLDIVEGDASTEGSIAKALADAKVYADGLNTTASNSISDVEDRLDILEGDSSVEGSVAKAIADVINAAPEALNTLKEIADYINVDPDTDVLSAITNKITDAKNELKGSVSEAFDTLGEIETAINVINGSAEGSIAKALVDAKAYTDAEIDTLEAAVESAASTEHDARVAEELRIETKLDDEIADRADEITRVEGLISAEQTRAESVEATLMVKANNLSDVVDVAAARSNLSVYSKAEADTAIRNGGAVFVTETVSVASDKVVLTNAPKNGVVFNFATVRHTDANFVSYDIPVTVTATAGGKEFQLHPNTTGEFDGKAVLVQYAY